jgi:hypothetical protein
VKTTIISLAIALAATAAQGAAYPAHPPTSPEIKAADISARVKAISDDAFQGRGPGTAQGEAAADWIAEDLKQLAWRPPIMAAISSLSLPSRLRFRAAHPGSPSPLPKES